MSQLSVKVVDRLSGQERLVSERWYLAVKKSSKNALKDGSPRYVLKDGEAEPTAYTPQAVAPKKKVDAKPESASRQVLTETFELSDETIQNFIDACGLESSLDKLVTKLGDRSAKWADKIDARRKEITPVETKVPEPVKPEAKEKPAPKVKKEEPKPNKKGGKK